MEYKNEYLFIRGINKELDNFIIQYLLDCSKLFVSRYNDRINGFQGSQSFINDKQFQNLSLDEIRNLIEEEKEGLKKDYKELGERKKTN